jgi:hypothetical protein|tara:strand:+ start:5756 stop:6007 length:252 start_codon:yes stop_codon:yes gene_type:complete
MTDSQHETDELVEDSDWTGSPWKRKSESYYYWMCQCGLLFFVAGFGVWLNYLWSNWTVEGLLLDVGFPVMWTWLAILLFDIFR